MVALFNVGLLLGGNGVVALFTVGLHLGGIGVVALFNVSLTFHVQILKILTL